MSIIDLLHVNAMADNELLTLNNRNGDVFTIAREVDFAFKTPDWAQAENLRDFIEGHNFGRPTINYNYLDDGGCRVIVMIHMPITQHVICAVSGFMVCLGRLFQVEFDGWGSVVQAGWMNSHRTKSVLAHHQL